MIKTHFVRGYIESSHCYSMEEAEKQAMEIVSRALDLVSLGLIRRDRDVYAYVYTSDDLFTPVAIAVADPKTDKPVFRSWEGLRKEDAA